MDTAAGLERALRAAGIGTASDSARAFTAYLRLLEKWGPRINLTASLEWHAIGPLFEEAVWAAGLYGDGDARHLDIGSGAGFPAIPMRILRPRMRLEMIESRLKRAAFLETVVSELPLLGGTEVIHKRLRDYLRLAGEAGSWDTISWKGVRLGSEDVSLLLERSGAGTRFWLFHGAVLPIEDPRAWEQSMFLIRRLRCPSRKGWFLSIYAKRPQTQAGCFT